MSAINGLAKFRARRIGLTGDGGKVIPCSSIAASGLLEAVIIRKPLSAGKYDEFTIIVNLFCT
jgi:hypothetical protein